jgi:hypothetical protein
MSEDRKKVWVNEFQTKLFLRITVYWLLYQVSVWNFLFIWNLLWGEPGSQLDNYWVFLLSYSPTLILFVLLVPFLARDAVHYTHRLVGPVVRFRRAMRDIAEGKKVRRIKLREGDFLTDLQHDFNQMLEVLEARGVSILHAGDTLSALDDKAAASN